MKQNKKAGHIRTYSHLTSNVAKIPPTHASRCGIFADCFLVK